MNFRRYLSVKTLLWFPSALLFCLAIAIVLYIINKNSNNINKLNQRIDNTNSVITFVIDNGKNLFRIVCSDPNHSGIFTCQTIVVR